MSVTLKNTKKKLIQSEFRKLMSEQKRKQKDVKKIESPLAKYNDAGQLTCILCKSIVKSESVWTVHINSKQHRENVELAKRLKEQTNNFTKPLKRPLTPPMVVPQKKVKGILKNSSPIVVNVKISEKQKSQDDTPPPSMPKDFFDTKKPTKGKTKAAGAQSRSDVEDKMEVEEAPKDPNEIIPEGFFDDPKLDAKARNQEYKDPVEEEWERFQKAIREADDKSNAIIADDQEESTTERQIDEIEEQMAKLSKVLDFEKKKETIILVTNEMKNMDVEENSSDENEDFDEYLDWRCKKAYK